MLFTRKKTGKKAKRRSLRVEERELKEYMEELDKTDPKYEIATARIKDIEKIQNDRITTWATVFKNVVGAGLLGFGLYKSYQVDSSDEIPKNRWTREFTSRFLKF